MIVGELNSIFLLLKKQWGWMRWRKPLLKSKYIYNRHERDEENRVMNCIFTQSIDHVFSRNTHELFYIM